MMEKVTSPVCFKYYMILVEHVLIQYPEFILAKIQWQLMWYAKLLERDARQLDKIKEMLRKR